MAYERPRPRSEAASFSDRLPGSRTLALALVPILLVGAVAIARAGSLAERPTALHLTGGASDLTIPALTGVAADEISAALSTGGGIVFEIVQTSTITARADGPPVEIPDPTDRTKSLGTAERYVMGTLIERGFATPDGYWMELLHGPEPGSEADFDLATADVSRQALVRDGKQYRNDGEGWHETPWLPGIGLDPATIARLASLVAAAADGQDAPLVATRPIDADAAADAPLGPETVPVDADAVAATIRGLEGPAAQPVRALAATAAVEDIPGIIAIDLADVTELIGPIVLRFDDTGRLVGLTILARNTHMDVHDLVVETAISLRYPESPPDLPRPEPAYVAPAPDPDGETEE